MPCLPFKIDCDKFVASHDGLHRVLPLPGQGAPPSLLRGVLGRVFVSLVVGGQHSIIGNVNVDNLNWENCYNDFRLPRIYTILGFKCVFRKANFETRSQKKLRNQNTTLTKYKI